MAAEPHSTPEDSRRSVPKRLLVVLVIPILIATAMTLTGTALAPALLADSPLLLVALNPAPRHLVLATNSVDALPFFGVVLARLFFADPFYYLLGRELGVDAVAWVERRSAASGRLLRRIERLFARAGFLLVFVAPAGLVCVLAGASRMRVWSFIGVNLLGTLTGVVLVRVFGAALAEQIEVVREFVQANVLALTLLSIGLVLLSSYLRRRRSERLPTPQRDSELGL